jgi:predicted nucleic acid-binding Zn ribbon protein
MCELNNQRGKKYCGVCAEPVTKKENSDILQHMRTKKGIVHLTCWGAQIMHNHINWQYTCGQCGKNINTDKEYCNADCREASLR